MKILERYQVWKGWNAQKSIGEIKTENFEKVNKNNFKNMEK